MAEYLKQKAPKSNITTEDILDRERQFSSDLKKLIHTQPNSVGFVESSITFRAITTDIA